MGIFIFICIMLGVTSGLVAGFIVIFCDKIKVTDKDIAVLYNEIKKLRETK